MDEEKKYPVTRINLNDLLWLRERATKNHRKIIDEIAALHEYVERIEEGNKVTTATLREMMKVTQE